MRGEVGASELFSTLACMLTCICGASCRWMLNQPKTEVLVGCREAATLPHRTTSRVTTTTETMGAGRGHTVITLQPLLLIRPCTPLIPTGLTGTMEVIMGEATETLTDAPKVATGLSEEVRLSRCRFLSVEQRYPRRVRAYALMYVVCRIELCCILRVGMRQNRL